MIKRLSAFLLAMLCALTINLPAFAEEHTAHGDLKDGQDATCTENGYWEYEDGCKIEIPALGHDYSSTTTVYHCINQAEITTYTCGRCCDPYDKPLRETSG